MRIALLVARVDALRVDRDLDAGRHGIVVLHGDGARHVAEVTAHGGDHQVLDRELRLRVRGIDIPRCGAHVGRDTGRHVALPPGWYERPECEPRALTLSK